MALENKFGNVLFYDTEQSMNDANTIMEAYETKENENDVINQELKCKKKLEIS